MKRERGGEKEPEKERVGKCSIKDPIGALLSLRNK